LNFKKPNIFVCGPSGTGKSSSLRNLDPERTVILNVERKQLPFRRAGLFKRQKFISSLKEFDHYLNLSMQSDTVDVIIIESFTSLAEMIMLESKKSKRGYEVFNWYADEIMRIISLSKNSDKYIVFLGIDESNSDEEGVSSKQVKVEGQKLKGVIEKEFVIVLYTVVKKDKEKPEHFFLTNSDGVRTAKSPMEMLDYYIPNDLAEVIKRAEEYYLGADLYEEQKKAISEVA